MTSVFFFFILSYFVHFEAKSISVFSREIHVNTRQKMNKCVVCTTSSSHKGHKNPSKNCNEQKNVLSEDPGILVIISNPHSLRNIFERVHFEAKIISVFSCEIRLNTRQKMN